MFILLNIIWTFTYLFFNNRSLCVYFTPSRNLLSSFRDFILLVLIYITNKNNTINVIAHLHGSDLSHLLKRGIYGKVLKKLYFKCVKKFIINSEIHKIFALGKEFNNYEIINNPIKTKNFPLHKINSKKFSNKEKLTICFISIPSKAKGLNESILFLENTFKKKKWTLNIVGWTFDDYKNIYENEQITDQVILKKINFLGKISDNDKYSVLLHSDLFILLSHTEAQPITVIEAGIFRCGIILSSIEMLKKYEKYKTVLIYSKRKIDEDSILHILNKNEFFEETQKLFINLHSYTLYKKKILELI